MRRHFVDLLAVVLAVAAVAEWLLGRSDVHVAEAVVAIATAAGTLLRRRAPWLPLIAIASGFLLMSFWGLEPEIAGLGVLLAVAVFIAADGLERRAGTVTLVATLAMMSASEVLTGAHGDALWFALVLVLPIWGLGRLVRGRRLRAAELEELNAELVRERARAAELAAEAERGRIARDLHDALSHGLSLMTLQAGAGERLVEADSDGARRVLANIASTGVAALADLDRMFGGPAEPGEVPALDDLIDRARATGLRARLELEGAPDGVPRAVTVAAHRIVQEAITNVVRHAAAGELVVRLRHGAGGLEVHVEDDGGGQAVPAAVAGGGRGLAGMRERAHAYGGRLEAGPRPDGGFAVRAWLPIAGEAA